MIKLKDEFYRYITPIGTFTYVVKGIRQYEGDEQYELECQNCSHGRKCLLLCALDDRDKLQYIRTLNDGDDDQSHFHTGAGEFFPTQTAALVQKGKEILKYTDEKILEAKKNLKYWEDKRAKDDKYIADVIEKLEGK